MISLVMGFLASPAALGVVFTMVVGFGKSRAADALDKRLFRLKDTVQTGPSVLFRWLWLPSLWFTSFSWRQAIAIDDAGSFTTVGLGLVAFAATLAGSLAIALWIRWVVGPKLRGLKS